MSKMIGIAVLCLLIVAAIVWTVMGPNRGNKGTATVIALWNSRDTILISDGLRAL